MIIEDHAFRSRDFVAGSLPLDFINTVTGRDVLPRDWLRDYPRLVEWARFRVEFDSGDLDALVLAAKRDQAGAKAALSRATRLREALCSTIYAMLGEGTASPGDRDEIERAYQAAMRSARFEWSATGCRLAWTAEGSGLELVTHVVAVNAVSLLTQLDTERVRVCAGENCGWVFLDSSRSGRRRWCDMATCGNVAKARRHYSRQVRP